MSLILGVPCSANPYLLYPKVTRLPGKLKINKPKAVSGARPIIKSESHLRILGPFPGGFAGRFSLVRLKPGTAYLKNLPGTPRHRILVWPDVSERLFNDTPNGG